MTQREGRANQTVAPSKASERIRGLVCSLTSANRARAWLIMLQAYVDDSGSEPNDPLFVLGGFVAPPSQWEDFTDEWDAKLREPISIEYFKSTEANGARDQFAIRKGWDRSSINMRIENLADIAAKHATFRVAVAMRWSDFNTYLKDIGGELQEPYNLLLRSPYFLCLAALRVKIHSHCERNGIDPLCYFTLDEQSTVGNFSALLFGSLQDPALKAFLGSIPVFDTDRNVLALQAADLYAYQFHDSKVTPNGGKPRYAKVRSSLERVDAIEMMLDHRYLAQVRETLLAAAASAPQFLRGGGRDKLIKQ